MRRVFLGLPIIAVIWVGCGSSVATQGGASLRAEVADATLQASTPASGGDLPSSYSGTVSPVWTLPIAARVSGTIVEIGTDVGKHVNRDDLIAVVDHRSLDDQVAEEEANVRGAQARLNRVLAGARPEEIAGDDANAAASADQITSAQANLEFARLRLALAQAGGTAESDRPSGGQTRRG